MTQLLEMRLNDNFFEMENLLWNWYEHKVIFPSEFVDPALMHSNKTVTEIDEISRCKLLRQRPYKTFAYGDRKE